MALNKVDLDEHSIGREYGDIMEALGKFVH